MQLKLIKTSFEKYKRFLRTQAAEKHLHIWESQRIFQENWDLAQMPIADMYDASLQNSHTKRLWKREAYEPKQVMSAFMQMQADFVTYMFKDLFNEEKSIGGRVDRFVFHCDELLQEYKAQHPRSIENNHYHGDRYQMISLYLAFRFPDQYSYYDGRVFWQVLSQWGTANIPKADDCERFCKISRTLYTLLSKEEELMELHQKRLSERTHYSEKSLLIVYDFYQFCFR
jgi:hypothetical protein